MASDQFSDQIAELRELASDPTLESCCRRDIEDQIRVAKVKATLDPQDRSQARQRLADTIVARPPEAQQGNGELDDLLTDDDEADNSIDHIRAARLKELQSEARRRTLLQAEGHGTLTTVSQRTLQATLQDSSASFAVCHIAVEGDEHGIAVDEFLEVLAHKYLGTRFLRCPVRPNGRLPIELGLSLPSGLVCFRDCAVTAVMPLQSTEEDCEIDDTALETWLRRRRALATLDEAGFAQQVAGGGVSGTEGRGDGDGEDSETEGDEWAAPCEVCGRRYPHQHVRSMYRNEASEDDDDGDSDAND